MGVNRRRFIMFVAGAVAGTLATPIPFKLADDSSIWTQNWPWIPRLQYGGIAHVPMISKLGAPAPVNVTTAGGRPCAVTGNAKNPLSQGGMGALAPAEVQLRYGPARIKGPLKKAGDSFSPLSWEEAEALLLEKMKAAKGKVAAVCGDETGTAAEVLSGLVAGVGSSAFCLMPGESHVAARAWNRLMQGKGQPGYDLENADCVLAIGADLFESFGTPVRNAKALAASRPAGADSKTTWIYAGPVRTRTAAVCDQYIPVAPGAGAAFALGLAAQLIQMGAAAEAQGFEAFRALVTSAYAPAKIKDATGVAPEAFAALAKTLASAKRPLVVAGSVMGRGGAAADVVAGLCLNLLLGNLGKPGGLRAIPEIAPVVTGGLTRSQMLKADLVDFLMQVDAGKLPAPEVLLVHEANPAYALPEPETLGKALAKVPFKVSFSPFMDETAAMCDLILPNTLSLERFEDLITPYGSSFASYTMAAPVAAPACDAKSTADVVLGLAKTLGVDLGFATFEDVLAARVAALAESGGFMSDTVMPWQAIADGSAPEGGDLAEGLGTGTPWVSVAQAEQGGLTFPVQVLEKALPGTPDAAFPFSLVPLALENVGSAKVATPPSNLTTIRDDELKASSLCLAMCGQTAAKAGVAGGDLVKVASARGEIMALVDIDEAVMPGAVAAPLGLGHTAFDVYSRGKGANVCKVLTVSAEPVTGLPVWDSSKVKIAKS